MTLLSEQEKRDAVAEVVDEADLPDDWEVGLVNYLVGQSLEATGGQLNPAVAQRLVRNELSRYYDGR